jgi:uncharacterized protein involved in exopolysaccharide biosynthesis/Mrp family chromosome partitioning ATPase/peptidoglycan/xylan/chitin deacetylase (PgdA/CDA1 family)
LSKHGALGISPGLNSPASNYPDSSLQSTAPERQARRQPREASTFNLRQLARVLSARRSTIGTSLALCLSAAVVYLVLSPPRYISSAMVLVDPPRINVPGQSPLLNERPSDDASIESQVQILRSDVISRRAIEKLGLLGEPQMLRADNASFPFGRVRVLISNVPYLREIFSKPDPARALDEAIDTLAANLRVRRIGLTQVLEVSYSSTGIDRAAAVPNAVIEAYIDEKQGLQKRAVNESLEWMKNRLSDSKAQIEAAERALEESKAQGGTETAAHYRYRLKELEAYAQSHRSAHGAMQLQYNELMQKRELPVIDARVLEAAKKPKGKSQPQGLITVVFAAVVGLMIGVGCAILREYLNGFRSTRDVEDALGLRALGVMPRIDAAECAAGVDAVERPCAEVKGARRLVLDQPMSPYAEAFRAAHLVINRRRRQTGANVVAITSALAREGRSTICGNLAQFLVASGARVLMIDSDRHNRSLSRSLAAEEAPGLFDVLTGEATLESALRTDPVSGASFLPVGGMDGGGTGAVRVLSGSAIFLSRDMGSHIARLADGYDYVLVCLPPFANTIDAASSVGWVDSFLLVVEWGRAMPETVASAFASAGSLGGKVAGAILNKVDPLYLARTEDGYPFPGSNTASVSFILPEHPWIRRLSEILRAVRARVPRTISWPFGHSSATVPPFGAVLDAYTAADGCSEPPTEVTALAKNAIAEASDGLAKRDDAPDFQQTAGGLASEADSEREDDPQLRMLIEKEPAVAPLRKQLAEETLAADATRRQIAEPATVASTEGGSNASSSETDVVEAESGIAPSDAEHAVVTASLFSAPVSAVKGICAGPGGVTRSHPVSCAMQHASDPASSELQENDHHGKIGEASVNEHEREAAQHEHGVVRRLAGQIAGGALLGSGALARGIAKVRDERLVTHIYFHQPKANQFRGCLTWLLDHGYTPVSTADLIAASCGEGALPRLPLHISLDDAFRSNLKEVIPAVVDLDIPITLFVPTDPIERGWYWWSCVERKARDGGLTVARLKSVPNDERLAYVAAAIRQHKPRREAMTIGELKRIAALRNLTIGSHTVTHPILTQCSDAEVERELVGSKEKLEHWIGKPVVSFAYPNGSFGERELRLVRRAGYVAAFSVEQRHALPSGEDPLNLPRFALLNDGPCQENICRAVGAWFGPRWKALRAEGMRPAERPAV